MRLKNNFGDVKSVQELSGTNVNPDDKQRALTKAEIQQQTIDALILKVIELEIKSGGI